jgi:hypothetical protein
MNEWARDLDEYVSRLPVSARAFADSIGLAPTTLSMYRRGRRPPGVEWMRRIEAATGVRRRCVCGGCDCGGVHVVVDGEA